MIQNRCELCNRLAECSYHPENKLAASRMHQKLLCKDCVNMFYGIVDQLTEISKNIAGSSVDLNFEVKVRVSSKNNTNIPEELLPIIIEKLQASLEAANCNEFLDVDECNEITAYPYSVKLKQDA